MIQFIKASHNVNGVRVVLWRKGDYLYEAEWTANDRKTVVKINAEYYDALAEFDRILAA